MSGQDKFEKRSHGRTRVSAIGAAAVLSIPGLFAIAPEVRADEGGVSFWLPGLYGSLAAVPQQQPGWAFAAFYYHTTVSAGGDVGLAREFQIHNIPVNVSASLNASLKAKADLAAFVPSYAFATPVFGGQASISLMTIYGGMDTSLAGTLNGTISVPGLGSAPFTRSDSISSSTAGFGDLYPQFAIRWNDGVQNFMTYLTGDIPVGDYNASSLANIGIGHGAIDGGGGYTYFDPKTGHEFSAVTGFTYNFMNPSTNYQNGVDWHLDWGASQFLSKQLSIGLVGYVYDQVSADSGSGDKVGAFELRVAGIGPQITYLFPVGNMQGYVNLKAYGEFGAHDRPDGWNAWLTFSIAPAAPAPTSAKPLLMK